ncbi:unnamed protein product, partial [Phaeothamnion confervicola]
AGVVGTARGTIAAAAGTGFAAGKSSVAGRLRPSTAQGGLLSSPTRGSPLLPSPAHAVALRRPQSALGPEGGGGGAWRRPKQGRHLQHGGSGGGGGGDKVAR